MNELALFAGVGGGILGSLLDGRRTVCAVEIEPYTRDVLVSRQNDGSIPPFPIWDDIQTFDGKPWRGYVDVVSGGFPCQDISCAGKQAGISGSRSGLWKHMARIVREIQPTYVFVENSPELCRRGLDVVLADLSEMGYDAEWGIMGACDVGAHHKRLRLWLVAYPTSIQRRPGLVSGKSWKGPITAEGSYHLRIPESWKRGDTGIESESGISGVAYGVANQVDRIAAIGNGQVPAVASAAWQILTG